MLHNTDLTMDLGALLAALDGLAESIGEAPLEIDPDAVETVIKTMRNDAHYIEGASNASAFKKAASFIATFVALKPIKQPFSESTFGDRMTRINNHQNGYFALMYALHALCESEIWRESGESVRIEKPVALSIHSIIDIVDAISNTSYQVGYRLIAVLLEQIVYKTNPDCQYETIEIR